MARTHRRHSLSKKAGQPPGTLIAPAGEKPSVPVRITIMDYDQSSFQEKTVESIAACAPFRQTDTVTWINIDALTNVKVIEQVGSCFAIHPLILEDLLNTGQRPKIEEMEGYVYVTLKMLQWHQHDDSVKIEHVSLIIGPNYLISLQEDPGDVFDPVRDRIRKEGKIRKFGTDYLAYSLIDVIVDNYFVVMEHLEEQVEVLEGDLVENTSRQLLSRISDLKRDMIFLRKSVWPLREVIINLERTDSPIVKEPTRIYLRDVYDHTIQVIDTLEIFRDMVSGMIDIYLSSLSNRMNETMKLLTLIATIFIPLTFIVGVYGMNFPDMPELHSVYGYPAVWGVIIGVALLMVGYYRKRGWI